MSKEMKQSNTSLPQYLEKYLEWLDVEKGVSPKTQENYGRFLERFFQWLEKKDLESLKPHQLSPSHIWDYRVYLARKTNKRTGRTIKRSTQNYYLIGLRSFLNFLASRNIRSLPAEKINLAKQNDERQVDFLETDEVYRLLKVPDISGKVGLRDRAMLETLFSTGMRVSELTSLDRDQIKIKNNTTDLELGIVGKGDRPRTVYLSQRAVRWLEKYLQTRDDDKDPLFINYRRKDGATWRLTPRSIQRKIKKYALSVGLPKTTTPHVLRHSFATNLLSQGVDLRTVQEFLGHKNITATQIYTHVTSKRLRDVHRKFHGEV